ncbi:hypothetical protein ABPG74_011145 [Tetrahymena malaccensis]
MEFVCWLWTYDKRWMFDKAVDQMEKIWIVPLIANILLLGMIINSLYIDELVNDPCILKHGYKFWLQIQSVILCVSCINIIILYFKIIQIEKKKERQLETLNAKSRISPKKFGYWIRQKGLLSGAGFSVLILGLLNLVWVVTGFRRYYYNHSYTCARSFQNTLYANIIIPLVALLPFIFTLITSFLIKVLSLIFSWLMPEIFIRLKKSM